jgi:hypothetical protein
MGSLDMSVHLKSPYVFVDTLESFFGESGATVDIIASALGDYIRFNYQDYVGSFTDACNVRDILESSYGLNLPPIDAIQWVKYVNHNANYLGES